MKRVLSIAVFSLLFVLISTSAFGAKRYWIKATASKWNSTANWSSTSGGAGGSSVPGANDTAYFDGNGTGNDTLDMNISVKYLSVAAGYTGKIVQGTYTVTIGTTGAVLSGGTFVGGSAAITLSGPLTIAGCAFTSTSGTLSSSSSFTLSSGSFTHNDGTVVKTNSSTISGNITLKNLTFSASSTTTFTISNTLTVTGTLTLAGSGIITINSGTINAQGDIELDNTANATTAGGTTNVNINGSGNQNFNGNANRGDSRLPTVTINKSGGVLYLFDIISINGNVTFTAGSITPGTSTIHLAGTKTISGSVTLANLSFGSTGNPTYTINSGSTLTVTGELSTVGTGTVTLNTGNINVEGNVSFSNTGSGGGGTSIITLNGTGNQTLTGSGTAATGRLPKVEINKSSGTLSLASTISVGNNWTHISGTVNPGTSTVYIANGSTFTGNLTFYNLTFGTSAGLTIATGSVVTVTNTFYGNCTIINGSGYLDIKGDMTINTSSNYQPSGNVRINGSGTQIINGLSSPFLGYLPSVTIQKSPNDTLKLTGNISVVGGIWKLDSGIVDAGTSTMNINNVTVTGSQTWNNLTISSGAGSAISGSTELTVEGNLIFNTSGSGVSLAGNILNAHGNVTMQHTGINTASQSATIKINGTGNQTFTGSGTAGSGRFCNITIDKTSGVLNLASVISVNGHWNYIKGDVDPGTSSLALYGTFNLDGQQEGSSNMMRFYNLAVSSGTRTVTGNLDINNNFTISSGATCNANGNNMNVAGNWNAQGTFTYSTGTVTFDGSSYNNIRGAPGTTLSFGNVAFNRGTGSVTLQNPMRVNTSMTITKGRIKTTSTNYLEFIDNATCTTATHSAYVHGPVRKTGNDAFTFPLGDTTLNDTAAFHPLAITAPGATGDQFEAVYYASGQTLGDSLVDTLDAVSNCEYWTIARNSGTSSVYVTTYWNVNSCIVEEFDGLRASQWDGNKWLDLGASNISVFSGGIGSITTLLPPSFIITPVPIAIATKHGTIPYATLQRKLDGTYYNVGNGALRFKYDEEYQDADSKLQFTIYTDARNYPVSSSSNMGASLLSSIVTYYGDNRYSINIAHCSITPAGYLPSGFYVLEVVNEKNEKRYLRFKHTNTLIYNNCMPNNQGQ